MIADLGSTAQTYNLEFRCGYVTRKSRFQSKVPSYGYMGHVAGLRGELPQPMKNRQKFSLQGVVSCRW